MVGRPQICVAPIGHCIGRAQADSGVWYLLLLELLKQRGRRRFALKRLRDPCIKLCVSTRLRNTAVSDAA